MKRRPPTETKPYETRLDRFRVHEGIDIQEWADEAGMRRTQLNKYRSAYDEPGAAVVAVLVRSASRLLRRPVRVSELFDVGEEEPLGKRARGRPLRRSDPCRKIYDSRFDKLLRRLRLPPVAFARASGLPPETLLRIRAGRATPMISTVRQVVVTLRQMGYDVRAFEIIDLGE